MAADKMAALEDQLQAFGVVVAGLEATVRGLGGGSVATMVGCSADRPHAGRLNYLRGPNQYQCEVDGNVYVKDGAGGLKDSY